MLGFPIIDGRLTLARAGATTYWRSACPVSGSADRCMRQLAKPLYKVSRITSPRLIDINAISRNAPARTRRAGMAVKLSR